MGQEGGDDEKKQLSKSYFDVLGLCCSSEVPLIEKILTQIDGVKDVSVIVPSRTVIVVHDTLLVSTSDIVNALNQARLEANVKVHGEINHHKKWPSPYAVASGILLLLSFLKYAYHPFQWLALGAVAAGIFPVILKGFGALRNFRIDINILVLVAVIGTIAMQDYLEAGTIVFLFTSAEWLESRASHKASAEMSALMSIAPQTAVMAETGEVVDVSEIKLNTILAVKAGEVIPIDGIVVDGKCEVDEKTLTGESFPITKQKDSNVWAGTINLNGYVSIKTTVIAEDCVVAKMAKLVEEAQNKKSRTQRFVDKCAKYYTPAILVISICFAIVPVALRVHNRNHWFHLALVVLVSACPCALVLSTPVATFCALTKAAKSGLLIKGGDYLETLAKIRNIALDKTGTITRGEFVVEDFRSLDDDISSETLLYWVSSIESKSSHPMAAALVGYARSFSVEPKPELVQEFQNFPGEGIYGKIDGKDVYIGNKKIAVRAGCETVSSIDVIGEGKTVGLVFSGTNPVGVFSLSDACRSGAVEAIKELKSLKIKTAMLTGDSKAAAMHSQNQLGHALDVVHSELLPEDKAKIIQRLKEDGPTAMVGDGINDAPALATADIGISMGISGSALATETGHVILMSNDIRKIPKAITLARKAHRKVVENVILSIGTKGAILALAFAGHPLVWAAVLADAGTCIVVILNSMLLLREHNERKKTCCRSSAGQQKDRCRIRKMNSANNHPNCCSSDVGSKVSETEQCSTKICALKCQTSSPVSGVAKNCCSTENSCRTSAPTHDHSHSHGHDTSNNNSSHVHHCCSSQSKLRNGRANSQQSCRSTNCHSNDPEASICRKSKLLGLTKSQEDLGKANCVKHRVKACDGHKPCCSKPNQSSCCSEEKNCNRGKCVTSTRSGEQGITEDPCHKMHCDEKHCSKEGLGQTNKCRPAHNDQLTLDIDHCWKSGSDCCPPAHHTVIDVETSSDCTESASIHICNNLVKREVGGCCKSYMKECCGKQGHLASGLGGCLAEIISE